MKQSQHSLARIVQPVVVLALFLIFLKLFALDAWARFRRDDVQIQTRMEEDQSLNTPAITICLDTVRIAKLCCLSILHYYLSQDRHAFIQ